MQLGPYSINLATELSAKSLEYSKKAELLASKLAAKLIFNKVVLESY
jgi:hypothetical protein